MAANDVPCCETMFWVYLLICIALVSFAGLMSGLTLGLMSLNLVDLEILAKAGQPQDRKNAEKILPIVKNQHLLLCTLLIGNSLAMEALPIFLDALLPAWGAILISVTLILAFGEIIPQAVCSRYGLSVGAKLSGVVRVLIVVIFPLSYPISKVLDWLLGKGHSALLRRSELKLFVGMHGNEAGKGGELTHDETTIITGALDMTQKTVKDAMTPISNIFSLEINSKLDESMMELIISKGHSRIPIYSGSPTNIIGLILVKNLIKCRPEDETLIRDVTVRKIPRVNESLPLYDMLNQFQNGQSHMAAVVKNKKTKYETAERNAIASPTTIAISIDSDSEKRNGKNQEQVYMSKSSLSGTGTEVSELSRQERRSHPNHQSRKSKKGGETNQLTADLETMSRTDEEVIGIITIEDVIEELLQEEILDETDGYVDAHNRISINMLAARTLLSRSPGTPQMNRLSPVASSVSSYHHTPVSSCNHTPVLRSPIAPWSQSPTVRATFYGSPRDSIMRSPSSYAATVTSSPPSFSRKSYEKLKRTGIS